MDEGLDENLNNITLCSQHFDESCFDRTLTMKIRLKSLSMPMIHILRTKYEKISAAVSAMKKFSQTKSEISSIDAMTTNMSTATVNHSFDMDTSITMEESKVNDTLQMNTLVRETDISLEILPSDTPKKVMLKKKIASLGRSLAEKSSVIRNLQKKNWKQQKKCSS